METRNPPSIANAIRTTNFIAAALAVSVVIYVGVALGVAPRMANSMSVGIDMPLLAGILAALSIIELGIAEAIQARGTRAAARRKAPLDRLAAYRTTVIIALAVRESIAIYGLVLAFLSGDPRWSFGFGAVALAAMLVGWPKRVIMEQLASEVPPIESAQLTG